MVSPEAQAIERDWRAVGGYLTQALLEVAEQTGDQDLIERVSITAAKGDILPDPAALLLLERAQPGSAESVVSRTSEIQQETHRRERREARMQNIFGKHLSKLIEHCG